MNLERLAPERLLTVQGPSSATPTARHGTGTPEWTVAEAQEFVPQAFDASHLVSLQLYQSRAGYSFSGITVSQSTMSAHDCSF